ncbi:MAG TPA: hypothetical protein VIG32_00665 [Candidatus Baltobacteraceae bacterium]
MRHDADSLDFLGAIGAGQTIDQTIAPNALRNCIAFSTSCKEQRSKAPLCDERHGAHARVTSVPRERLLQV